MASESPISSPVPAAASPSPDPESNKDTTQHTSTDDNEDTIDEVADLVAGSPRSSATPTFQRNQAPGILDRRKSLRPSDRSLSRGRANRGGKAGTPKKSRSPAVKSTLVNMSQELKVADGDITPGEASDAFEDATEAPRPDTAEKDEPSSVDGASSSPKQSTETKRQSATPSIKVDDVPDTTESAEADTPQQANGLKVETTSPDAEQPTAVPAAEAGAPGAPGAFPTEISVPKPSRLSQGLMSPPILPGHGRNRSVSPGRFPINVQDVSDDGRTLLSQKRASGRQSPVKGLSGEVPVADYPPPPSTAERTANGVGPPSAERSNSTDATSPLPQREGLARKASSGFGALLGRMGSIRKPARSPPAPRQDGRFGLSRRGTGDSATTLDGASTVSGTQLSAIADEGETAGRPSLKDQFATLRKKEEENNHEGVLWQHEEGNGENQAEAGQDGGAEAPAIPTKESAESISSRPGSNTALKSPTLDRKLPPGTASGLAAGPAADEAPVNWDLWQFVVYEGPAAVARTSGAELSAAIASGIPPAIRGVVWQVLADSKSDDLEALYRTLKTRGTDAEHKPPLNRADSSYNGTTQEKEKDSVASSSSSAHSESSTPATTVTTPPPSVDGANPESKAKLLLEKQKRDAAALQKLEKAIKRDLGARTSYSKYAQSAGLQDGLFGVCKAYALFDEAVGYAQGINFIAMPLLFNMGEEEAFTLLVRLMHKYNLRTLFEPEMPGLHLQLYQFERLLEDLEPALYCHLKRRNVGPQLYATQWFLTLFAYRFPLQLVLRIYDLLFSEGLPAILRFGIVLMQRNRSTLLEMKDMAQLTTFLKERLFDVYIDKSPSASSLLDSGFFGSVSGGADRELYHADALVRDATAIQISDETLAGYTAEWEEQQRARLAADTELDSLRTSTALLTQQVKNLEERAQAHDTEHVGIASELVRLKVENDGLADENEGLKVQVQELTKMVDLQPAEVEARLREEMEAILKRNEQVGGENRKIKEEADEMEVELVNVKMALAQTQTDYDLLKQRWTSVQAMLNNK